MQARWIDLTQH